MRSNSAFVNTIIEHSIYAATNATRRQRDIYANYSIPRPYLTFSFNHLSHIQFKFLSRARRKVFKA